MTVAALFVHPSGAYSGIPDVELWDEARDARRYDGPHPVVAHPPCQRWGRFYHGGPSAPHTRRLGDDAGCFAAALASVRRCGGVLEHPAYSHAWFAHGLPWPAAEGWQRDVHGGWCCQVEQGHYGHPARKPTWLYAVTAGELPALIWTRGEQRLDPRDVERFGRRKASRIGIMAHLGGGGNAGKREATPPAFRDLLLSIARGSHGQSRHMRQGTSLHRGNARIPHRWHTSLP